MNWFTSIITAFCSAGICLGSLLIISPTGKTGKSVQYIVSLCFLLIIISAVGVNIRSADFDIGTTKNVSVDTQQTQLTTLKYTCAIALKNAGIDFKEISVCEDNSEIDGIKCNKVVINSNISGERIVNVLGGESEGFKVEVINE